MDKKTISITLTYEEQEEILIAFSNWKAQLMGTNTLVKDPRKNFDAMNRIKGKIAEWK